MTQFTTAKGREDKVSSKICKSSWFFLSGKNELDSYSQKTHVKENKISLTSLKSQSG